MRSYTRPERQQASIGRPAEEPDHLHFVINPAQPDRLPISPVTTCCQFCISITSALSTTQTSMEDRKSAALPAAVGLPRADFIPLLPPAHHGGTQRYTSQRYTARLRSWCLVSVFPPHRCQRQTDSDPAGCKQLKTCCCICVHQRIARI